MKLLTNRLIITEFNIDMALDIHLNSLDIDNKRFVPDEVFETVDEAKEVIEFLISQYNSKEGPFVYPILTKDLNQNIGYVQLIKVDDGFEIGYHIAKKYTGKGYATEAVMAFLEYLPKKMGIDIVYGICLSDNIASKHVLNKCGFEKVFEGLALYQGESRMVYKSIYKVK
ncbi:MAG: GNAT family N-acetyltransferase [Acholeplasmatales bacterium]|nr:GNAT family N-acetyltransferase [Acholeplasmatales bacterium]